MLALTDSGIGKCDRIELGSTACFLFINVDVPFSNVCPELFIAKMASKSKMTTNLFHFD